jgi:hypothetical protein
MIKRLLFVLLTLVASSHAQLSIAEFMASNSSGLQDELGNEEDWLEIQNTSTGTVNLSGWYLSDEPTDLRKWPMPAWTLAAGNRMVVFASSRNLRPTQTSAGVDNSGTVASPKLATNFKIGTDAGGFLALSQDQAGGGVAVISSFASYPKQLPNIAYGFSINTSALVTTTSPARALVPTIANGGSALGTSWRGGAEPFTDSSWTSGTPGVGASGISSMVSAANLKLRLNANDAANLVNDTSGAVHHGVNTSNSTIFMPSAVDTQTAPVLRRGALQFAQASNSQVTIAAHADFNATSGTIMFWMKAPPVSGGGNESSMIWDRRIGGVGGIIGLMNTTFNGGTNAGKLFFQPNGGGTSFYSTARVDDNQWHHIAFVYNQVSGGTDTFYVDGVASGMAAGHSAWSWPTAQQIELGRSHDGYWHKYDGLLDEVRFYNAALTPTQIASIFNGADENVAAADIGLNVAGSLPGNAGAFVRIPFSVGNPASFSSLRLTSRVNDGFVAYLNGTQVASFNAPASPAYNSTATSTSLSTRTRIHDIAVTGGLLNAGSNILAIHALNNSTSDVNFLTHNTLDGVSLDPLGNYLTTATPGSANSSIRTNIGPIITNVTGSPGMLVQRPTGGAGSADIGILASVTPSLRPLATTNPVKLAYRTMYNAETVVNMTSLGNNLYMANIPTTGLSAGQMLRWRVIASDNTAVESTAPAFLSATDSDQYYGTVAVDNISTQLPIYHVFVPGTYTFNNAHPIDTDNQGGRGSFFYDGELYDNVFIRIKGDTTRTLQKRSHRVDFNSEHQLRWAAGQGRLRELNLNAEYVDPSYSRQFMSMWFHRISGTGAANHFPVRCQINGQFWQLAFHTETQDSELLDAVGVDKDGALYASVGQMAGVAGEKQTRVTEPTTDMANFVTAITQGNLTNRENNVFDQIDLPAVINYIAAARMMQEGDDVWANMVIHRDSDGTGEWQIIPFDLNLSWGQLYYGDYPATHTGMLATDDTDKSHPLYGNASCYTLNYAGLRYNRFYDAIISVPRTRQMLLRRIRTLMDNYLQPPGTVNGIFEQQLDTHIARISQEVALDKAQWGWPGVGGAYGLGNDDLATAISELKNGFIIPRRTHYFTTHTSTTNVGIANANSAGIPATPQPATFPMTITAYDYNPTDAGKQNAEWIQITNPNAFAADISGWSLSGAVNFTFKSGTVVAAGTSVYVSPRQQSFRARTTTPRGGEGRFVVGPYSGQISARGEIIELRDALNAVVASQTTPTNPTAGQQQLRITELNFNPGAPTAGELASLPGVGASDFEWLEIQNIGATSLAVGGATFTKGITFTFPVGYTIPAGARIILVANQAAFTNRNGSGATIAGTFAGNLANSGEELEIIDPNGEVILDFFYENSWFPPADGGGRTLVVRSATPNFATYDAATHWAISGSANGTPGSADADFANHFDGWRWDQFAENEIYLPSPPNPNRTPNTALVGPGADADGDGLNNLGEYAFGKNARLNDNHGLATAGMTTVGADKFLTITFVRRHKALDLIYTIETTDNLAGSWTPTTEQVSTTLDLGNGVEQVTFRDTIPQGTNARFIRVRAAKP